jgi:hypothetical protein
MKQKANDHNKLSVNNIDIGIQSDITFIRSNKKLIARSTRQTPKQNVQNTANSMEVNFLTKRQL